MIKARLVSALLAPAATLVLSAAPVHAVSLVAGSDSGAIVFGVSPYGGAPNVGNPTFIGNNVNGRNDVLSSPGLGSLAGYLTANPVAANNIAQIAGPLPGAFQQFAGFNAFGPFGAGAIALTATQVGFGILDTAPGGGSASYGIATWEATFEQLKAPYVGTFGNWLGITGVVSQPGNAAVASLRTYIESANPASPFFGGVDLAPLVLAASNNGAPGMNLVARGTQALTVGVPALGLYKGLAINSFNVNIPAGDSFVVKSTLTIYADPASIQSVSPLTLGSVFNDPGFAGFVLPEVIASGMDSAPSLPVPEPSSALLLALGMAVCLNRVRRRVA